MAKTPKYRNLEVCLTPDLFRYRQITNEVIIIVVDIFRAGSTICAALSNGFTKVKPVSNLQEAQYLKAKNNWPAAGERNGEKLPFTDFGNSPVDISKAAPMQEPLILTTSNGTRAVEMAQDSGVVVIGGFNNLKVLNEWLVYQQKNVLIFCSGWMGTMSMEDTLFAGALSEELLKQNNFQILNDEVIAALHLWHMAKNDLSEFIKKAKHYQRLEHLGAIRDIEFALTLNNTNVLPYFDGFVLSNILKQ